MAARSGQQAQLRLPDRSAARAPLGDRLQVRLFNLSRRRHHNLYPLQPVPGEEKRKTHRAGRGARAHQRSERRQRRRRGERSARGVRKRQHRGRHRSYQQPRRQPGPGGLHQ